MKDLIRTQIQEALENMRCCMDIILKESTLGHKVNCLMPYFFLAPWFFET